MIEFTNVSKFYNNSTALEDINLSIDEGEFVFLVGPSGSGKTTIIKLLIKEEDASTGHIFFYDTDITALNQKRVTQLRREIGVVFQDFKLLPNKNLFENISFAMEASGKKKKDIFETVPYVLKLVNLYDRKDSFPHEISGGEKQRIAIARAIANNPKVLIADEPTGNLDPQASWEIINLLTKINEWGTTVIMATHGRDIVDTLGKRVIQLDKGKITSDNKKGAYPTKPIPINVPEKQPLSENLEKDENAAIPSPEKKETLPKEKNNSDKKSEGSSDKDIDPSKLGKKTSKKPKSTKKIKEQELNITFTTTQNSKKKSKEGDDVVDLSILNLPSKIESKAILAGYSSIKKLKEALDKDLLLNEDFSKAEIKSIQTALEKNN